MNNPIKKFTVRISTKIKKYFAHEACYKKREKEGTAALGSCSGIWGGDYYTEYLAYSCVGCSHYTKV
jgi:hypothetical protein